MPTFVKPGHFSQPPKNVHRSAVSAVGSSPRSNVVHSSWSSITLQGSQNPENVPIMWAWSGEYQAKMYTGVVPSRSCTVRFQGREGVVHEVTVMAESLFEATARALRAFRDQGWSLEDAYWTGQLEIVAKQPEIKHRVLLKQFDEWLKRTGGSPKEILRRQHVKRILEGG